MQLQYLTSKYWNLYNKIIDNRLKNPLPSNYYTEKHHIVPLSLDGSNENSNIVKLSAREHFLCHYLLTKFTEGEENKKMWFAFHSFSMDINGKRYKNSRLFEIARKKKSELMKGDGNPMYGKTHSEETKKKISNKNKGKLTGEKNPWHKSNKSEEEIRQRSEKSQLAKNKNYSLLTGLEKEERKLKFSNSIKNFWDGVSEDYKKAHKEKSTKWMNDKSQEDMKKINAKKSKPNDSNPRAKMFILKYNNKIFKINLIKNLKKFCIENNIIFNVVYKYSKLSNGEFVKIPKPSKSDTKYKIDTIYKKQRDKTSMFSILSKKINKDNK